MKTIGERNQPTRVLPQSQAFTSPAWFRGVLQRKCMCGASDLHEPAKQDLLLQRKAAGDAAPSVSGIVHEVLRMPGISLDGKVATAMEQRFGSLRDQPVTAVKASAPANSLAVNAPGDRYEQEADRIADSVMSTKEMRRLSPAHTFSRVRVHTDARAADSARALGALAYTAGNHIVFSAGQYAPETPSGQYLLAHELTHTLQQSQESTGLIMRTWDKAETQCADAPKDKWIDKVVVHQEAPQRVDVHWTDDTVESDKCSTGKGHCCVDDSNPSGVACTVAESHVNGSNCTPITQHMGFLVKNRVLDHKGVNFWSEFEPDRAIALHQYDDQGTVDGTPLSHGCVRLRKDMAQNIFCNVRQNQTWVQVQGFARPKCSWPSLQAVWQGDFLVGGLDLSKADGDEQANIRETRRELNAAFGRTLSVDEIKKLTAAEIPRCTRNAPLPKPPSP